MSYTSDLQAIEREYPDVIISIDLRSDRLRVYFVDSSFLDIWFSRRIPGKYAFHWEYRNEWNIGGIMLPIEVQRMYILIRIFIRIINQT